jgi:hypothetical protein
MRKDDMKLSNGRCDRAACAASLTTAYEWRHPWMAAGRAKKGDSLNYCQAFIIKNTGFLRNISMT